MTPALRNASTNKLVYDEQSFPALAKDIAERHGLKPAGFQILVAMWIRPEGTKSAGGIILTDQTLAEDEWQGKVGVVIEKGPAAYSTYETPWCEDGDWVVTPKHSFISNSMKIGGIVFAYVNDDRILGTVGSAMTV